MSVIAERIEARTRRVCSPIVQGELYFNRAHPQNRSRTNIPTQVANGIQTNDFPDGESSYGSVGLKGHDSIVGLRAGLHNAVTIQADDALVNYLNLFSEQHA